MNIKKLAALFFFPFLFFRMSHAQGVLESKTLFFSEGVPGFQVYSDIIKITKVSNDTTWFNTSESNPTGQGFYFITGQRVFRRDDFGDFLFFDYNLVTGDTFWRSSFREAVPYRVDSVYYKKMGNRRLKAWHLTEANSFGRKMEWVEGLGELRLGWNIKIYGFIEMIWVVKGICLNDTLMYWNSSTDFITDPNPSPSCMFDSIQNSLSVQKVVGNSINIYPNPAADLLNLSSSSGGIFNIIDCTGKICMENKAFEEGSQTFDLSILKPGVYLAVIQMADKAVYRRICIVKR